MKFTIKISDTSSETISLHSKVLDNLSLSAHREILISIGALKATVTLAEHHEQESIIFISKDIFTTYSLPDFLEYEIRVKDDILFVGPVIGLLIKGKKAEMNKQRMKIYKNYLHEYSYINGLILLLTSDEINVKNKTIYGYVYHPIEEEWVEGNFPFPSVVFCRKAIKDTDRSKLNQLIGEEFFNSHVFNKWEMWEWFSAIESLSNYLPETVQAKNISNVKQLLEKYETIFIKPISGMQGTGIYQLAKQKEEYHLKYRLNGRNTTAVLDSWQTVEHFLRDELNLEKYIAQKRLTLLKNNNRVIDFRIIVLKDANGSWFVPGMITRFGAEESIVSNISSGGSAEKAWSTLMKIYNDDAKEAFKKYKEMEQLAILCCATLELKGLHLAYVGMDVGMDDNKNLWVIEINNRNPDMTIALDAEDKQLYYRIKSAPLFYAKWLAGFGGEKR
ncbi:YheC/YheD family protein [Lederbergia citrea]|uniref:YheC/YheD family endospore coat-associated protein n=1 Tax=Lederbergia citrea TaxID=2833581 RepID=UPI001BC97A08|nr:YheC/YheD family protein [Lederbergia citrea]MBS4203238.1 YheC/YheD family protein [Lederbergia citrea]